MMIKIKDGYPSLDLEREKKERGERGTKRKGERERERESKHK